MFPEEVYKCGLPLPFELLRPISFQLAYELIKEKLRFPTKQGCRSRYILITPYNKGGRVLMSWYYENPYVSNVNDLCFAITHTTCLNDQTMSRRYLTIHWI